MPIFRDLDRDTPYLLPPSVQDWLPEGHLARFIADLVDQLDLGELERAYQGRGKAAYHPALLLSVLFYGYATGVFSSRKLEQATYESLAFRYLCGNTHPDHDTIATFRKRFLEELKGLFVQLLVLARESGVLKLGKVSLDGTKIKANASMHKALSWEHAQRLEEQFSAEVEELLKQAEQADEADAGELDIPAELARREARLKAIRRAKEVIAERARERDEAEQAEYEAKLKARAEREARAGKRLGGRMPQAPEQTGPRARDQMNLTDEQSRVLPSGKGFVQGYNAQIGVDVDSHLIVENHLSHHANDKQELAPALERLTALPESLGEVEAMLADNGYFSEANVEACHQVQITPYISTARERHNRPLSQRTAEPSACPEDADPVTLMKHRLQTAEGKQIYAKRKSTVETVFGLIKHIMGFRQFHLRGEQPAEGEWNLVCMAWNIKRLHRLAG